MCKREMVAVMEKISGIFIIYIYIYDEKYVVVYKILTGIENISKMYFLYQSFLIISVVLDVGTGVRHTTTNHSCLLAAFYTLQVLIHTRAFLPGQNSVMFVQVHLIGLTSSRPCTFA